MKPERQRIEEWYQSLAPVCRERVDRAVDFLCRAKEDGGKIVVVTGSGPNIHEGVTTLLAELMRVGIVDGVTTSSAVVAHEMAGVLDRVKRVNGRALGIRPEVLPLGDTFEFTLLDQVLLDRIAQDIQLDWDLLQAGERAEGRVIIKAAGNIAYPMGLWSERMADRVLQHAIAEECPFETIAGRYADDRTIIGQGARRGRPVLVTIPQLVGGGAVGLAIGDSISITQRARLVADLLSSADVIVESAVALTQEIHDGPFETHTGHGIWAAWQGLSTFSLEEKKLIRIDLDPTLYRAWQFERECHTVQEAIDKGLPKAKLMDLPFRMEMSGFARLKGSLPIIGDIGLIWPILAARLEERLGVELEFVSAPQQSPEGQQMREWIVREIGPMSPIPEPVKLQTAFSRHQP